MANKTVGVTEDILSGITFFSLEKLLNSLRFVFTRCLLSNMVENVSLVVWHTRNITAMVHPINAGKARGDRGLWTSTGLEKVSREEEA